MNDSTYLRDGGFVRPVDLIKPDTTDERLEEIAQYFEVSFESLCEIRQVKQHLASTDPEPPGLCWGNDTQH